MSPNKIESYERKRPASFAETIGNRNKNMKSDNNSTALKPLREYGIGEPGSRDPGFVYLPFEGDAGKNGKWDELVKNMPELLKERGAFAEALNSKELPEFVFEEKRYSKDKEGEFNTEDPNLRADLQMLAASASAYVNYTDHEEGKPAVIPAKLSKPLVKLADMAKVNPMLNYAHYAIDNRKGEIPYTKDGQVDVDKVLLQDGDHKWERVRYERNVPEGGTKKDEVVNRVKVGTYANINDNTAPKTAYETYLFNKENNKSDKEKDRDVIGQVDKVSHIGQLKFRYPFVGGDDELGFVQIHTVIEAIAAKALEATPGIIESAKNNDSKGVQKGLNTVAKTFGEMEDIFHLSPAYSRVSEYQKPEGGLRPFIMGFTPNIRKNGVIYEDEFDNKPKGFRGESGAMSSTMPFLDELLGFKPPHKLYDGFRQHMPAKHREFLDDLRESAKDLNLRELGGDAFKQAALAGASFRKAHADNAMEYLHIGKSGVIGTGGTRIDEYLNGNAEAMKKFAYTPQAAELQR
jgi:hypothetical protein